MDIIRRSATPILVCLALAACEDGGGLPKIGGGARTTTGADLDLPDGVELIERDVEAPEVYNRKDTALWGGRPSLGGIWVAHPDVSEPTRVIIRNLENDTSVVGALFRREVESSGPPFQISSDAAKELKITPGKAVKLQVTALVREQGPAGDPNAVETPPEPPAELKTSAAPAPEVKSAPVSAPAPTPAAPTPKAAPTAEAPAAAVDAALTEAAAATTPYILAGSYKNENDAVADAEQLRAKGFTVDIQKQRRLFRVTHRVVVGPLASAEEASALVTQLQNEGFPNAAPIAP